MTHIARGPPHIPRGRSEWNMGWSEWNMGWSECNMRKIKRGDIHETKLIHEWQRSRVEYEVLPRVDEFCRVDGAEFDFVHIPCRAELYHDAK